MRFLMGLDDDYEQERGRILGMDPLPPINRAYFLVQQIEKQKKITNSISRKGEIEAYVVSKTRGRTSRRSNLISFVTTAKARGAL